MIFRCRYCSSLGISEGDISELRISVSSDSGGNCKGSTTTATHVILGVEHYKVAFWSASEDPSESTEHRYNNPGGSASIKKHQASAVRLFLK